MSVSEDRTVQPSPTSAVPGTGIADPAPLGLAAFAATTFLLSAANAGWMTKATGDAWLGYAFAYGGFGQLLATDRLTAADAPVEDAAVRATLGVLARENRLDGLSRLGPKASPAERARESAEPSTAI